jgi:hypothetical protein
MSEWATFCQHASRKRGTTRSRRMRAPGKRERRDGRSAVVLSGSSTPTPWGLQLGAGGNAGAAVGIVDPHPLGAPAGSGWKCRLPID